MAKMNNEDKIEALEATCDLIEMIRYADENFVQRIVDAISERDESNIYDMISDINFEEYEG